jgi:hypothetical protein
LEYLVRANLRYAPTRNEGVETGKPGAEHSMIGKRRLMVKYPNLDGRQRKVDMSKAELPENQVLTVLALTITHGLSSCSTQA